MIGFRTGNVLPLASIGNGIRALLLMLALGALGGNLLSLALGQVPLVGTASASRETAAWLELEVSDVEYEFSPSGAGQLKGVTFRIDAPSGPVSTVAVEMVSGSNRWFPCRETAGGSVWTCPLPGLALRDIDQLRVVAW